MKYAVALLLALAIAPAHAELDWESALNGPQRAETNKARDASRHPRETLEFFGIKEGMTVVELSPGGGWYTEVLAPLVAESGQPLLPQRPRRLPAEAGRQPRAVWPGCGDRACTSSRDHSGTGGLGRSGGGFPQCAQLDGDGKSRWHPGGCLHRAQAGWCAGPGTAPGPGRG